MNTFIQGDFRHHPPPRGTSLILTDPPYDELSIYRDILAFGLPTIFFMYPETLCDLPKPDGLAHWIKPVSTKNTKKHYSSFVELIAYYRTSLNITFRGERIHWSNRTGIFADTIIIQDHPWKKPESLIEKLIKNHYPGCGTVYDPCAGSGTVHTVCKRLGISSYSVELHEAVGLYVVNTRAG